MGTFWLLTLRYVLVAAVTLILGIIGAKIGISLRKAKNAKASKNEVEKSTAAQ